MAHTIQEYEIYLKVKRDLDKEEAEFWVEHNLNNLFSIDDASQMLGKINYDDIVDIYNKEYDDHCTLLEEINYLWDDAVSDYLRKLADKYGIEHDFY